MSANYSGAKGHSGRHLEPASWSAGHAVYSLTRVCRLQCNATHSDGQPVEQHMNRHIAYCRSLAETRSPDIGLNKKQQITGPSSFASEKCIWCDMVSLLSLGQRFSHVANFLSNSIYWHIWEQNRADSISMQDIHLYLSRVVILWNTERYSKHHDLARYGDQDGLY